MARSRFEEVVGEDFSSGVAQREESEPVVERDLAFHVRALLSLLAVKSGAQEDMQDRCQMCMDHAQHYWGTQIANAPTCTCACHAARAALLSTI